MSKGFSCALARENLKSIRHHYSIILELLKRVGDLEKLEQERDK